MDVGSVTARLGAVFENEHEFDRYDRAIDKAKRASNDVKPTQLKGDYDGRAFQQYDRASRDVDRSSGRIVGAVGKSGVAFRAVGTGAIAAGAGVGLLAKSVIASATDINESLSKNQVLFGKQAKAVDAFSKTTAASFGISRRAALEATGTFGNLFTALELGPKKSADMSISLTKLAADMASFNNSSPEEALEAIRSGLVGETEPLRKFGVNLNDAALRTEALHQGLVKTTKEALTPQQKALAVNALLFKQTEKAQGDFARTSGGLANQQRILKARLSDIGAQLGNRLLPITTKAATAINDLLSGKGAGGSGLLAKVSGTFNGIKRVVEGTFDFLGQIYRDNERNLGRLLASFSSLVTPVRRAINQIVAAFRKAFSSDGSIGEDIRSIIKVLVGLVTIIMTKVFIPIVRRALPGIVQAFQGFAKIIRGIVEVIAGVLTLDFGKAWDGVKLIFSGALKAIGGMLRAQTAPFRAAAAAIGKAIGGAFSSAWNGILSTASGFVQKILDVIYKIPGLGSAPKVNLGGSGGDSKVKGSNIPAGKFAQGGKVTMPVAIMGEEAPEHPEWVIPTNPAYRSRAVGLWMMAAREIGIPGFAAGGLWKGAKNLAGDVAGKVGSIASAPVKALLGALPSLPGGLAGDVLGGAFKFARDKAIDYIKSKAASFLGIGGGGGGGADGGSTTSGTLGIANRVAEMFGLHITSGYRSPAHNAAVGGVEGSLHTHGSAGNPGAIDSVGPVPNMLRALAYARANLHLREAMVHDVGSGLHLHMGFFRKGGKHAKKKKPHKPPKPVLSKPDDRGVRRSAARGERGIANFEDQIQGLEREYGQLDRRYGLTDEEIFVENDDGSITVDESAQGRRLKELDRLTAAREAIKKKIIEYRRKIVELRATLLRNIRTLQAALAAAKGKARQKERGGYRERIAEYQSRRGELQDVYKDLGYDADDSRIDLQELFGERKEIAGAKGSAAPADAADTGGGDTTGGGATDDIGDGSSSGGGDTVQLPPSAEDIARAGAEQLAAFNANRADLFASFGQNFNRTGSSPFGTDTQRAAGARFFGAVPGEGSVLAGAGGGVVVNNHFDAPPPDPHSWSQGIGWELRQAV